MSSNGTDDGEDDPKTYRDYKRAKNDRLKHPEEAGPRDPAEGFDGVGDGEGGGFGDVLEGDGNVEKSRQDRLEDVVKAVDFLHESEPEDGEKVSLSLSEVDLERAQRTPQEREEALLRGIRAELHALSRQAEFVGSGGGSSVSKEGESAVELLETIEDELERRDGATEETEGAARLTEEEAQILEDAANLYVEAAPENSVDDPLTDIVAWMQDQAGDLDGQARGQVYAALASIQNTEMEQSETLV